MSNFKQEIETLPERLLYYAQIQPDYATIIRFLWDQMARETRPQMVLKLRRQIEQLTALMEARTKKDHVVV